MELEQMYLAAQWDIQYNVFFFAPPLSRHYITQSSNVHQLTLSLALTLAPCSNNSLTTDSCPYQQARWRGVKENYKNRKKQHR